MKEVWSLLAGWCLVCTLVSGRSLSAQESYGLSFSTYIGGTSWEHARDVCADVHGNVYLCGGTASRDFPTTPGAYDRTFDFGDTSGDECDAFICKFGSDGRLLWSTYLGSPGYDRAYGIEVDAQGYVYVAGRAGRGFPTTAGSFQPTFQGYNGGGYGGYQNGFVAKLAPDGSQLLWASYVGVAQLCRDIAIDAQGDIYLPLGFPDKGALPPGSWFTDAFQKTPGGGMDCGVIKVAGDGSKVLWATWLGGSGNENNAASVRVGRDGRVYVASSTTSADFPTTAGAFDRTYNGGTDYFIACLTPDGSDLVYATFLGGPGSESLSTHNLALDDQGNAYVALQTTAEGFPTTAGAVQPRFGGGATDMAVAKLSPAGALLAATYLGGRGDENADGVYVDASGNVLVTGVTSSNNFPVTANACQGTFGGNQDAVLVRLSPDFRQLLYSTFLGGPSYDNGRSGCLGSDGTLYVTGSSDGPGWPLQNAYQSTFAGGPGDYGAGDAIIAKLVPARTITLDPGKTYQTGTDLLGYWKFDEGRGTAAVDSSTYGHHGRLVGPTWVPGKVDLALAFDGLDDYVQIPPDAILDNLQALTIAAWIYPREDKHWHLFDKGDGDKRLYSEGVNRTLDGRVRYSGTHAYSKSPANTILLNEWQHVAMTWSQATNTTRLYHNGAEIAYTTQDIGTGIPQDDADYPFIMGARGALGPVTFLNGVIDELHLYGRPLSTPEIGDLYTASTSR